MADLLKSVETYRVETSDEADTLIAEHGEVSEYELTKSTKDHKVKKDDDFYLVTLTKVYN